MQSLHDLSHLEIIFQKAQSHISMVLFVAPGPPTGEVELIIHELGLPEGNTDCPKEGSWTGR